MFRYALKRIALLIPILIGVSLFIFVSMNLARGDYVDSLNTDDMTPEQVHELRVKYGLDKPLLYRYVKYIWDLLHGDLGTSYVSGNSVWDMFMSKIGLTAKLAVFSTIVCMAISIPLGIIAARNRGSWGDNIASFLAVIGLAMPNFWLGLLLIILFSLNLGWVESGGYNGFTSLILPAITVGTGNAALLMRTTRSAMVDALSADYLRTARAKGVSEHKVVNFHALKNAMIPILQIACNQFALCFGGAVLTESVFTLPGVGKLVVDSVNQRDVPMVCGCLILKCTIISLIGLLTDLLFVVVDPRVKTQYVSAARKKGGTKHG